MITTMRISSPNHNANVCKEKDLNISVNRRNMIVPNYMYVPMYEYIQHILCHSNIKIKSNFKFQLRPLNHYFLKWKCVVFY
jgi:hypothetical protein